METLTTFVVDSGGRGHAVRALAEAWTRAGILTPSLWVTPETVRVLDVGPPVVSALYVHSEGTESVDLFEHVGRYRLSMVRVVAAHLVPDGAGAGEHEGLRATAAAVAAALESALPRRADLGEGSCRLHRAVVVVPASGVSGIAASAFDASWEVNAVISPEDRPDLDRSNVFVRHPGNFDGHAAAALAAVGGIVRGLTAGALDDLTTDSTSREAEAVVARVSMRSIIGEDIVDRIAAKALDTAVLSHDGPAHLLHWARPAARPDLIAQAAAGHLLQQPEWADAAPPAVAEPRRGHQGVWRALLTAASFNVRTVGAVTSWFLSKGRSRAEARATEAIVGAGSGVLVTLGPRPVDDLTGASARLLERERARIDAEMRLQATRTQAPPASTWTGLRRLAFGLVDGGDLGDFPEPRQAGKRELLAPRHVVVEPGKAWTRLDGRTVFGDDPRGMRDYQTWLKERLAEGRDALVGVRASLESAHGELGALAPEATKGRRAGRRRKTADAASPPDGAETQNGDIEDDARPGAESEAVTRARAEVVARVEKLEAEVAEKEREVHELEQERDGYALWYEPIAASVLWQVADDVARRVREMRQRQEEISKEKDDAPPPAQALRAAHKELMSSWAFGLPFTLLVIGLLVWLRHGPLPERLDGFRLATDDMWWGIGITTAIAVFVLARANHRYYRAVRRYEWDVEQRLSRLQRSQAMFVHAGQQRVRLQMLYDALHDWVDVLGELLHRPWATPDRRYDELPPEVLEALPASMGVASQIGGEEGIPNKVMIAAWWVVYAEGWASRQFERAHGEWEREESVEPDEGHRAVDLDASDSPTSPRRRLREFIDSGAARAILSRQAVTDLLDAIREGDVEVPERTVERMGRYGDGARVPEREFFRATATDSTLLATDVFSPAARTSRKHYVEKSVAWLPAASRGAVPAGDAVEIRGCDGPTALRVDLSRRIAVADLTPFATSDAEPDASGGPTDERAKRRERQTVDTDRFF